MDKYQLYIYSMLFPICQYDKFMIGMVSDYQYQIIMKNSNNIL